MASLAWAESREEHMRRPFVPACILPFVVLASTAQAQNTPQPSGENKSALALFQQMVGTWDVQQRMWPAAGAQAINLPPAIARRHLIGDAYLEETMELAESKVGAFTRNAFFNLQRSQSTIRILFHRHACPADHARTRSWPCDSQ